MFYFCACEVCCFVWRCGCVCVCLCLFCFALMFVLFVDVFGVCACLIVLYVAFLLFVSVLCWGRLCCHVFFLGGVLLLLSMR